MSADRRWRPTRRWFRLILCVITGAILFSFPLFAAEDLPVKDPATADCKEKPLNIRNLFTIEQLYGAIKDGEAQGLEIDLTGVHRLLDGTSIDPARIYGVIYVGPYPFEAQETDYDLKRFRRQTSLKGGKGTLDLAYLFDSSRNSEDWFDEGVVAVRLELFLETEAQDKPLGIYDTFVRFRKTSRGFVKLPTVIEGPFINLLRSDDYANAVISFRTSAPGIGKVILDRHREFLDPAPTTTHEIEINGLKPNTVYHYQVEFADYQTKSYAFQTAPRPGQGTVTFAYIGDSREGIGGGERNFMGLNYQAVKLAARTAYRRGAQLLLMGGDLVNGYTTSRDDFRTQLYAWKQAVSGFWHERPVYTVMGNHESLLKAYDDGACCQVVLDRWPYATDSAEAVFAAEFVNPGNGPRPADPRRPPYKENVYSFQYGPVKFVAFNNCYWPTWKSGDWEGVKDFGGSPEGYIMADQLAWLKRQIDQADRDPTVKYLMLIAHLPAFPNSDHLRGAMWYHGNNRVRAYTYDGPDRLRPEDQGIIEVRNELAKLVARSRKVAAVLASHEHCYAKLLINKEVPIGDPAGDDGNGNGILCESGEGCSPLRELRYPTWYIVSGGAGAPYCSEIPTPWNQYWKAKARDRRKTISGQKYYSFTSQENILFFQADQEKISLRVYNPTGQLLDRIDNLLAVKGKRQKNFDERRPREVLTR